MALPVKIQKILDELEPQMAKAFQEAIDKVTSSAQLKTIIGHIESGNIEAVILALRLDPSFFHPMDRAIQEAYFRGGAVGLLQLPAIPNPFLVAALLLGSMDATSAQSSGSVSELVT